MKKKIAMILLYVLFFLALGGKIIYELWESGAFIFERTATVYVEGLEWDGRRYSSVPGEYSESRTIAKAQDGWVINEVEQDPTHTFVVARSFLDQHLCVADDYTIPTDGKLTKAAWGGRYIRDDAFLEAVAKIELEKVTTFSYQTDAIYALTDTQQMRSLRVAYEDCPVATNSKGYLGKVNGQWVITTHIPSDQTNADGSAKVYTVDCYVIPEEYHTVLEKHFR